MSQDPENKLGRAMLHDYAEVRGLVAEGKHDEAITKLDASCLDSSTKQQLRKALDSKIQYVIDRTFGEIDSRVMQALCWKCWRD